MMFSRRLLPVRFLRTSARLLEDRPLIPNHIKTKQRNIAPSRLFKDTITSPEYELTRVVPQLNTYYGGNPLHEATINRLSALVRKYMHLPTRELTYEELHEIKFLSYDEYANNYIKSDKVKAAHHKDVLNLLNKLRSIDSQLMPKEVIESLNEFISETNQSSSQSKSVKTFDANGIVKGKGGKKSSRSNIKLVEGEGLIMVNGKNYTEYFTRNEDRQKIVFPLFAINKAGQFNIFATVNGGGISSQADAVRLGIIKTLGQVSPIWKKRLLSADLKSVDARIVERKKPGKVKARKSPTWVKR